MRPAEQAHHVSEVVTCRPRRRRAFEEKPAGEGAACPPASATAGEVSTTQVKLPKASSEPTEQAQ